MAFQLKLTDVDGGTYTHPLGSSGVVPDVNHELRADGVPWLEIVRWKVEYRLRTGASGLDAQMAALRAFLRNELAAAEMLYSDGSPSYIAMGDSGTNAYGDGSRLLGTVRCIKPPNYMRYQGGEHVCYRTGVYILECFNQLFETNDTVIEQTESVSYVEVGEKFEMLQPNEGDAVRQMTREFQHSTFQQSGIIRHTGDYFDVPLPLYPANLLGPVQIEKIPPRRIGTPPNADYIDFGQRYTYTYGSSTTMDTDPTVWE